MTFLEWLFSSYPNPHINGQWGLGHILTLISITIFVTLLSIVLNKFDNKGKGKKITLISLVILILLFEIIRRTVNIIKLNGNITLDNILKILLPRPWCAISCWVLILSVRINKNFFYNFASITSMLCSVIFFAYPGVGYNNQYILFENLYSIMTHTLLLTTSILLITLKFTKFEFKGIWNEALCLLGVYIYSLIEIFILKIAADPLYYMPNGDITHILGINSYPIYLLIYCVFIMMWGSIFYLISKIHKTRKKGKKIEPQDVNNEIASRVKI